MFSVRLKRRTLFFFEKKMIEKLTDKVLRGERISLSEAMWLADNTPKEELYSAAHAVTQRMANGKFDLCSITNVKSGACPENCKWCSQSTHNATEVEVYGVLQAEACAEHAAYYAGRGVGRYSLVASGRRASERDIERLCENFRHIGKSVNISLCASLGLLDHEALGRLKAAGVQRYHCNLETAPSFFASLCTTHTQGDKIATIEAARRAGLEVCSGGIIGMGESMEQRIELAFTLRDLDIVSIPINILNPIKGTPLENSKPLTSDEILTTIALFRFINPTAALRFAGGRTTMSRDLQSRALYVGINAAIAGDMLTTAGEDIATDKTMITQQGYTL